MSLLQRNAKAQGGISFVDQAFRLVCSPIASVTSGTVNGISGYVSGAVSGSHLQEDNNRLKRQIASLSMYSETIASLQKEVDSLRIELGLDKTYQREKVVADITGYFPQQNKLTLNAGRNKGIKEGMPAVCAQGLIGKVQTVGTRDCQVILLTSPSMQLGAIALKYSPPPAGLIYGENSSTLLMKFSNPDVPVASGDIVFTSGFGDLIPRGIVIGRVLSAESMPELGSSRARIFPAVNVGDLREVVILK